MHKSPQPHRPVHSLNYQICNIHLTLAEFDKDTVELVPDKVFIPDKIEMPQYVLDQSGITLDYLMHGKFIVNNSKQFKLLASDPFS